MVVVGDNTQIDLISKNDSGLIDASKKLKNIQDIGFIELDQIDVIRHEVVRKIINAYEQKNSN
jgi:phosphate starvation-inducible PhoH-like protein